jgi:sec-independent protein translocase protein TatA
MGLSLPHLIVLLIIVMLLFGAGRVPSIAENLAKGIRSFKKGLQDDDDQKKLPPKDEQ